jgi:hypothetical protein
MEKIFEMKLGIGLDGIGLESLPNIGGYWDGIFQWLNEAVELGFVLSDYRTA